MAAPQAVLDLIERFDRNREACRLEHEQTVLLEQIRAEKKKREVERKGKKQHMELVV